MSGFTALNLEPEENLEQEVDDSREIQIEEALKLYQNALKLHSQGSDFVSEAAEAYDALFRSEIFRYPEVASEFVNDQLVNVDDTFTTVSNEPASLVPTNAVDGSPNSLLQVIHLSFKNYGQFLLDRVKSGSIAASTDDRPLGPLIAAGGRALTNFAEALERDDSDLDLWRKAARISGVLSSNRIVRFCLESVLVTDEDNSYNVADLMGLDELSAFENLKATLTLLGDDLSANGAPAIQPNRFIASKLKQCLDPYPYLPKPSPTLTYTDDQRRPLHLTLQRETVCSNARSWTSVGMAIYQRLSGTFNEVPYIPGQAINVQIPPAEKHSQGPLTHITEFQGQALSIIGSNGHSFADKEVLHDSPDAAREIAAADKQSEIMDGEDRMTVDEQLSAQLASGIVENFDEKQDAGNGDNQPGEEIDDGPVLSLPTRKRSSTSAGNDEAAETGRIKSKRLRARESNADAMIPEEEAAPDLSRFYEDQLTEISQADDQAFATIGQTLETLRVYEMSHLRQFREIQNRSQQDAEPDPQNVSAVVTAMLDLQTSLGSWTDEKGQAFLLGDGTNDLDGIGSSRNVGLALFQEHSKPTLPPASTESAFKDDQGLEGLIQSINKHWTTPRQAALKWIWRLISPLKQADSSMSKPKGDFTSSYTEFQWPPALKELLVKTVVQEDEILFDRMQSRLDTLEEDILRQASEDEIGFNFTGAWSYAAATQTLFELHLDIYCAITNPSSEVDKMTRIKQKDRLHRWNDMASSFINQYSRHAQTDLNDGLILRFLYASTLHSIRTEGAAQDHIMMCLKDLQTLLERCENIHVLLPNNAAMPEISASAVNQEMSRLSTLDFFMAMFNSDESDPVAVIESLEPILDTSLDMSSNIEHAIDDSAEPVAKSPDKTKLSAQAAELVTFLEQGNASLRLFLWRRLRDAYKEIDYQPKIVSCYLRSLAIVMKELNTPKHLDKTAPERQLALLRWLRSLDELVIKILGLTSNVSNVFECIDESHLRESLTAIIQMAFVLYAFASYEDSVRIGQIAPTIMKSASSSKAFEKVKDKIRDMLMRLWTLLYKLLSDGIGQFKELFSNDLDDKINYLRFVHKAMGMRHYCRYSNKVFLKLIKHEFIAMKSWQDYENDLAQVLFDLYGLRSSVGLGDYDHGCTPEPLDKRTANQIIEFVMTQANRINVKDIAKSELKATLEKMQQVIGSYKTTPALSFNKRLINNYMKAPINPAELFNSLKGLGDLSVRPVRTDSAAIAATGWYFLQGLIALTRFKSVKRVNPTSTDDLDIAAAFFRQDLDHDIEKWETWFRLAQIYDLKIDEDTIWTADKINNQRGELATLQRHAIHCYAMAVAASIRTAETTSETAGKISDMYTEFATRLYASSREPLSMQAFNLDNYDRHYSQEITQQMYKAKPFQEMKTYAVWNLAAHLLKQACLDKPKKWINYYILGKCLWKMIRGPSDPRTIRTRPGVEDLIEVLVEAVENLPPRRDNRSDPILEPHIKIVSIVHKLVKNDMILPKRGVEILQVSPWARKVHLSEEEDGWEPYILQILKNLGQADKSNWHHRIIARAAHVIYDDNEKDLAAALGAKHEFTQQIFTKTMTLQVWKPDNERAGRHFVYTSRYVSFFINILYQLNDRTNLDMLARRIRRKPSDYMKHGHLWDAICTVYINMLRKIGKVPLGLEETVFKSMNQEELAKRAPKVEEWAHDPETSSPMIDILRDAIELKKLNNSLMKGTAFDDLIADAYAKVYETYFRGHPESEVERAPPGQVMAFHNSSYSNFHTPGILNIVQTDGTAESTPYSTPPPMPASYVMPPDAHGTQTSETAVAPQKPIRNKPVSRRELTRRADALISRNPTSQPQAPSKPSTSTPGKALQPIIEIRTSSNSTPHAQADRKPSSITNQTSPLKQDSKFGSTSAIQNAPTNSVGNTEPSSPNRNGNGDASGDADDESAGSGSELSEIDEEEEMDLERKAHMLFPGLMAAVNRSSSPSHSGSDDEGNGREDEDDEGEGVNDGDDNDDQDGDRGSEQEDGDVDEDEVMADVEKVLG